MRPTHPTSAWAALPYIDLTNHESVPQSQTSRSLRRRIPGQPILSRLS